METMQRAADWQIVSCDKTSKWKPKGVWAETKADSIMPFITTHQLKVATMRCESQLNGFANSLLETGTDSFFPFQLPSPGIDCTSSSSTPCHHHRCYPICFCQSHAVWDAISGNRWLRHSLNQSNLLWSYTTLHFQYNNTRKLEGR